MSRKDHELWSLKRLHPKNRPIIALVAKGISNDEIGERLFVSGMNVGKAVLQIADAWKQSAEPRSTLRLRLALCFLLGQGHLEAIDWPVPGLPDMRDSPYKGHVSLSSETVLQSR